MSDVVITGASLRKAKRDIEKQGYCVEKAIVFAVEDNQARTIENIVETVPIYSEIPDVKGESVSVGAVYDERDLTGDFPDLINVRVVPELARIDEERQHDLRWWHEHANELLPQYKRKWIGIGNEQVVAAYSCDDLGRLAKSKGIRISFIRYVQNNGELRMF